MLWLTPHIFKAESATLRARRARTQSWIGWRPGHSTRPPRCLHRCRFRSNDWAHVHPPTPPHPPSAAHHCQEEPWPPVLLGNTNCKHACVLFPLLPGPSASYTCTPSLLMTQTVQRLRESMAGVNMPELGRTCMQHGSVVPLCNLNNDGIYRCLVPAVPEERSEEQGHGSQSCRIGKQQVSCTQARRQRSSDTALRVFM